MELSGRRIAVVGAGIGGVAAALALAQRGAAVTVYERAEALREVGAGLQISPNGFRVLRALGLEAELAAAPGAQAVRLRDGPSGRDVLRLPIAPAADGAGYRFLHRADLLAGLIGAAEGSGVALRLGCPVTAIHDDARPRLTCPGAAEEADLVIGADGLHSVLRPLLNGPQAARFTGQVAWRAVVPNRIGHPDEAQVHMGPGRHIVSYPLRDRRAVNLVAVEERNTWTAEGWQHEDAADNLRAAFAGFGGAVPELLAAVERPGLWGLFRHPVAARWTGRASALLGDAAHPMLPFLAQGANMALEDAWVLAQELERAPDLAAGLAAYEARRRARVVQVARAAAGNAWKFHLRQPLLRGAAHAMLGLAGRLAPQRVAGQFDWLYGHDVTRA
ncbi:FAD-dependent monooxygenase [Roseivivax sp. CAU 1761]